MPHTVRQGEVSRVEDFVISFESFLMQVATPIHHVFVGQFWLASVMSQAPRTSRVVTFDTKDTCALDL
jgi:hypothetical protein